MDTVFEIIGWLSIPLTLLSVGYMVLTWRREQRLSARSLWTPVVVSLVSLVLYVGLIGLDPSPLRSWLPFIGALVLGLALGGRARAEVHDGVVTASRNPWSFLAWGASFAATQFVALLAPGSTEAMLTVLFAATGLTVGEQLALVSARADRLGGVRAAGSAAAAVLIVVVLGAVMAPRAEAADTQVDLGDIAGMRMDDDVEVAPSLSGVGVAIKGTPSGTYSGPSIDVTIENTTGDTLRVRVPVGTKLYPADAGVQTMLTAGNEVIVVPPGATVSQTIEAYCGEPHDRQPYDSDTFTVGERVTGPILDSLEAISERTDDIHDPESPLDPASVQTKVVWSRLAPDEYPPPAEDDPTRSLFDAKPAGPTEEETGKAGAATTGVAIGGAVLSKRPARGGRRRGGAEPSGTGATKEKGPAWTEKPPPTADDALETVKEGVEKLEEKVEEVKEGVEQAREKVDEVKETARGVRRDWRKRRQHLDKLKRRGRKQINQFIQYQKDRAKAAAAAVLERPLTVGGGDAAAAYVPATGSAGARVGDTVVGLDKTTGTLHLESSALKGSFNRKTNEGFLGAKDGSFSAVMERGGAYIEAKGRTRTTRMLLSRSGRTKNVLFAQEGGPRKQLYTLTDGPQVRELTRMSGKRTDTFRLEPTLSFSREQPGMRLSVSRDPAGFSGSFEQQRTARIFGEKFDVSRGLGFSGGEYHPRVGLGRRFIARPFGARIPLEAKVVGVGGPGSHTVSTIGIRLR
ncbi:MAG: hypothetical protein OEV40_12940 [Acidimicrobiia bacterium]|nr:hypothetical protein [Acidimicrobiia bacterium]